MRRSPFQHLKDAYALRWKPRPRGVLSASINATPLEFITVDNALFDFACTVSSGVHSTQPLLILTTLEENDVLLLMVSDILPRTGKVTLAMCLHADRFKEIFRACHSPYPSSPTAPSFVVIVTVIHYTRFPFHHVEPRPVYRAYAPSSKRRCSLAAAATNKAGREGGKGGAWVRSW